MTKNNEIIMEEEDYNLFKKIIIETYFVLEKEFEKNNNTNWIKWLMDKGYSYNITWSISSWCPYTDKERKYLKTFIE